MAGLCVYEFSTFISASTDGTLKIWDLRTKKSAQTLTGHRSSVTSVAVSD